ncbi:MAG TPA: ATP synthase F1 subunit delta [Chryseosolibacter sp.]|jgi:F-type H+-transporting ATPase subunit delta|nr:ATP synthase F1 subunit delta [Chryseosolibacter sp.]
MAESRAAFRYVKSLLGLAVERNALEAVHKDMLLFSGAIAESRQLELLLHSPVIKHHKKLAILKKLFSGKMNALTLSFFEIITRKNRESILVGIAREFHNAYNEYKGIGKAQVITTVPLDAQLRGEFEKLVRKYEDKKQVELIEKVDPELIGGFILNVGDRQVDASVRSKLKSLKVKFSQNPYIKEL